MEARIKTIIFIGWFLITISSSICVMIEVWRCRWIECFLYLALIFIINATLRIISKKKIKQNGK